MIPLDLALAMIVLAGLVIQTMTGFGFNVVAVTLGALLLPIKIWLPVVVALNLPMSAWVAWRNRDAIDWTLLLRQILPVMAVGFAVGVAAAFVLSGNWLRTSFGVLVVLLALRELLRLSGWVQAASGAVPQSRPARCRSPGRRGCGSCWLGWSRAFMPPADRYWFTRWPGWRFRGRVFAQH